MIKLIEVNSMQPVYNVTMSHYFTPCSIIDYAPLLDIILGEILPEDLSDRRRAVAETHASCLIIVAHFVLALPYLAGKKIK